jgi:hypothetical protein
MSKKAKLAKLLADLMSQAEFKKFFQTAGRRGGLIGGRRTADKMTPEERTARAKKAARARWGTKKQEPARRQRKKSS